MEQLTKTIMQLIGSEVCDNALHLPFDYPLSDSSLMELYNTAKAHDVGHIVSSALINNGLLKDKIAENFYHEQLYATLFKYENQCYVFEKVCNVLERAQIPYIPLKGAVLKNLYPQPWMRTGCDIDILVREKDVELAAKVITETLGYSQKERGKHDVSILSTEGIYLELHFSLLEEDYSPDMSKVLNEAWKYAHLSENGEYRYEFYDSMFYFYHLAHMAKHFINGGCGLRPFLDLWLMERDNKYLTSQTKTLLKKGKLLDFAENASRLSRVWFSGEEHDTVTLLMQDYIISGGCFGSAQTKMMSGQQRSGGRVKYVLSRIFIPYDDLKKQYPIIKRHRFLTPACQICRWFSLLFGKKKKFRKVYLNRLTNVSDEHIDDINLLFESVGL